MFTGIIEALGTIVALTPKGGDIELAVAAGALDMTDVALGDSIAVSGVCLTVTRLDGRAFAADVSRETLARTSLGQLAPGAGVNLEKAMLPTTRFGGHIVSGHVDATGRIAVLTQEARSLHIEIEAPAVLARYIAEKGSITVDGVSLTVNAVNGAVFALNIIPHTAAVTTIGSWRVGRAVNLEVDMVARYLERLLSGAPAADRDSRLDTAFLAEHGFLK